MPSKTQPSTAPSESRQRLDQALVDRGLAHSRSRARDMILRGCVRVDDAIVRKAGIAVSSMQMVSVNDAASGYVSRAALKLLAGLDKAGVSPRDRVCVDLGASTGGFTQVLLEREAKEVWAIDVGHDQFHDRLTQNPRVRLFEGTNARHLTENFFTAKPQAIVSDVSFISLRLAAEPTLRFADHGAWCVLLIKPQFELGPDAIGKGGIVIDPKAGEQVAEDMARWLDTLPNWRTGGLSPSPIRGGDGNQEFLLWGVRDG